MKQEHGFKNINALESGNEARTTVSVVLISWVDWPEIGPLVEEIPIQWVDRAHTQSVDSSHRAVKRVLYLAGC